MAAINSQRCSTYKRCKYDFKVRSKSRVGASLTRRGVQSVQALYKYWPIGGRPVDTHSVPKAFEYAMRIVNEPAEKVWWSNRSARTGAVSEGPGRIHNHVLLEHAQPRVIISGSCGASTDDVVTEEHSHVNNFIGGSNKRSIDGVVAYAQHILSADDSWMLLPAGKGEVPTANSSKTDSIGGSSQRSHNSVAAYAQYILSADDSWMLSGAGANEITAAAAIQSHSIGGSMKQINNALATYAQYILSADDSWMLLGAGGANAVQETPSKVLEKDGMAENNSYSAMETHAPISFSPYAEWTQVLPAIHLGGAQLEPPGIQIVRSDGVFQQSAILVGESWSMPLLPAMATSTGGPGLVCCAMDCCLLLPAAPPTAVEHHLLLPPAPPSATDCLLLLLPPRAPKPVLPLLQPALLPSDPLHTTPVTACCTTAPGPSCSPRPSQESGSMAAAVVSHPIDIDSEQDEDGSSDDVSANDSTCELIAVTASVFLSGDGSQMSDMPQQDDDAPAATVVVEGSALHDVEVLPPLAAGDEDMFALSDDWEWAMLTGAAPNQQLPLRDCHTQPVVYMLPTVWVPV